MPTHAIDTHKLLRSLKATGKSANYTAEEIVDAFDAAQEGSELLTVPVFEARMSAVDARINALEAKFDAKLDALRAELKAEIKSSQVQTLLWLSGIILASNGIVVAVLARAAKIL